MRELRNSLFRKWKIGSVNSGLHEETNTFFLNNREKLGGCVFFNQVAEVRNVFLSYITIIKNKPHLDQQLKTKRFFATFETSKKLMTLTQYFFNVPEAVWNFYIGGYQPAQKWLKDRKGRELSYEDILHYQKVVVALSETGRVMGEVDEVF